MNDLLFDIALSYDRSITPIEKVALYEKFSSSKVILNLQKGTLKNILGRQWRGNSFNPPELLKKAEFALSFIQRTNIGVVRFDDDNYPRGLKMIPDYPFLLYYKGNIIYNFEKSIAVVGTRKPDEAGFNRAKEFSGTLAKNDYCIISGLAHGIDTSSHYHCLDNKGKTIAVLGCGIDRIYPAANKKIADRILQNNGAIISEYPPGILPDRWNFPRRNRIIVGLSLSVLIVQSPERSGSLITAYLALDYNRELLVVTPDQKCGRCDDGNIKLIRSGATQVGTPEEILNGRNYCFT